MKLLSELADCEALKILAVSKFIGNNSVSFVISTPKKGLSLPRLEVCDNVEIFSSNAAVLLFAGSDISYDWLEWEATQLQLCVWTAVKKNDGECLIPTLTYLENHLARRNTNSITGSGPSCVDLVLWSTLYPVGKDTKFSSVVFNKLPRVSEWFHAVSLVPSLQESLSEVMKGLKEPIKTSQQLLSSKPPPALMKKSADVDKLSVQVEQKINKETEDKTQTSEESQTNMENVSESEVTEAVKDYIDGLATAPKPVYIPQPVLPSDEGPNILITAALPYVNNVPHLGNIVGATLSADVFARFCRLRGYRTLYVCGTDEYGTATETKAVQEGVTPKEICDRYNKLHTKVYDWFNIQTDYFGRTTTEEQTKISQDIFWKLYNNGFILEDSMEQLLCEKCNRFLADRFCEGVCPLCGFEDARGDQCDSCGKLLNAVELKQPRCKLCKSSPVVKSSNHLFLDLPKLEGDLKIWLDSNANCWSANARGIAYSWLRDGLKPRCITRDLVWGTSVPLQNYTNKVFYVWYDAPIGYLSITANYTKEWEKWWKNPNNVKLYNFLGKDNVPFHAVIFPACELGTREQYTIVNHISATEYLNYEDTKFSKSRGVGIFGSDCEDTDIPSDIWRFYLLCSRPESQDSSFSWTDFQLRNNNELLNNFGNFVNRGLMFLDKYFDGVIPEMKLDKDAEQVIGQVARELHTYTSLLERVQIREALKHILNISRIGNQYIQSKKPWELVKPGSTTQHRETVSTVVGLSCNISCLLSVMLKPYLPDMSNTIQEQLNAPKECNVLHDKFICYLQPGHKIGQPKPLVQKIDNKTIEELRKKFAGQPSTTPSKQKVEVPIQEPTSFADPAEVERLTKAVEEQGLAVRALKSKGAGKMEVGEAVSKLLQLKAQLANAQGVDPSSVLGKQKKNKKK